MGVNNPFIRYKIYSTPSSSSGLDRDPGSSLRVICLLPEQEEGMQAFLQKVLAAARIYDNVYQVVLIPEGESIAISDQKWLGNVEYIFLFGVVGSAAGLQLKRTSYQVQPLAGSKIIQLPALSRIEPNTQEKQKLWNLLKKEFIDG